MSFGGGGAIIIGLAANLAWLLIRKPFAQDFGLTSLGYFLVTVSLSGMGLTSLGEPLGSIYLPRLVLDTVSDRPRPRLRRSVVTPLASLTFFGLQTIPEFIVRPIFAEDFLPMLPLSHWWALGDHFRIIYQVFAISIFCRKAHSISASQRAFLWPRRIHWKVNLEGVMLQIQGCKEFQRKAGRYAAGQEECDREL